MSEKSYAIIEAGGKQYKVQEGTIIDIEKVALGDKKTLDLAPVLLAFDGEKLTIGQPHVEGVSVSAEVLNPDVKDDKVVVFKFKNKTGYKKTQGHRQRYTTVRVKSIVKKAAKKGSEA